MDRSPTHEEEDPGPKEGRRCGNFIIGVLILCLVATIIAIIFLAVKTSNCKKAQEVPSQNYSSSLGQYRYAGVAADAWECSTIGADILATKRGSAVDAAVAAMICIGVINMQSAGIGGGHFMTVYDVPLGESEKRVVTIDARERAPFAAHRNMFANISSDTGKLSIGVPGEVAGLYKAWHMFGRLPWKELFEPTIKMCLDGHRITNAAAKAVRSKRTNIRGSPNLRNLLMPNGKLVKEGDIIKRPKMAATLQKIADDAFAFYNGSLAKDIFEDLQADGILTLKDLNNYTALVKEPLNVTLSNGNYTVFGVRPPASGAIFHFILGILNGYRITPDSVTSNEQQILTYHRIVEAFKFGYAKRSALGDEEFLGEELLSLLKNLTSPDYTEAIRAMIDDSRTHDISYYGPTFRSNDDSSTSHVSVVAPDGAAVALTSSINTYFGSFVRGRRTGIIFNNAMDDFASENKSNHYGLPPSPSNYIEPGKRPLSSISPSLMFNNKRELVLVMGAAGGPRITTQTALVTLLHLWLEEPLVEAVDAPRLHHQLGPNNLFYEQDFPKDILEGLQKKGHNTTLDKAFSVVNSIANICRECTGKECSKRKCLDAVTDKRKISEPDGY